MFPLNMFKKQGVTLLVCIFVFVGLLVYLLVCSMHIYILAYLYLLVFCTC